MVSVILSVIALKFQTPRLIPVLTFQLFFFNDLLLAVPPLRLQRHLANHDLLTGRKSFHIFGGLGKRIHSSSQNKPLLCCLVVYIDDPHKIRTMQKIPQFPLCANFEVCMVSFGEDVLQNGNASVEYRRAMKIEDYKVKTRLLSNQIRIARERM